MVVRMLKRLTSVLIALGLVACTTPTPQPQGVTVILTSGIQTRPYTGEELAIPALQESIIYCEQQGWENCDSSESPVDNRSEFSRTEHSEVNTLVQLSGVKANQSYTVEWKLYNPNGDLFRRYTLQQSTPTHWHSSYTLDYWFNWEPIDQASWQLGRWRIELFVNGVLEVERSYDVVEN